MTEVARSSISAAILFPFSFLSLPLSHDCFFPFNTKTNQQKKLFGYFGSLALATVGSRSPCQGAEGGLRASGHRERRAPTRPPARRPRAPARKPPNARAPSPGARRVAGERRPEALELRPDGEGGGGQQTAIAARAAAGSRQTRAGPGPGSGRAPGPVPRPPPHPREVPSGQHAARRRGLLPHARVSASSPSAPPVGRDDLGRLFQMNYLSLLSFSFPRFLSAFSSSLSSDRSFLSPKSCLGTGGSVVVCLLELWFQSFGLRPGRSTEAPTRGLRPQGPREAAGAELREGRRRRSGHIRRRVSSRQAVCARASEDGRVLVFFASPE